MTLGESQMTFSGVVNCPKNYFRAVKPSLLYNAHSVQRHRYNAKIVHRLDLGAGQIMVSELLRQAWIPLDHLGTTCFGASRRITTF